MAEIAVAALDLGGTYIRTGVVDSRGRLAGRLMQPAAIESGAQDVVERCVISLLESIAQHESAGGSAPVAVGISAPGPLDPVRGVLLDPPNLHPSFRDFALADAAARGVGLPCVLDRDTQVAALAEGRFGAAAGLSDYVYLTVSTGVGGAVVSEGRLLRGERGLAGELGHTLVDLDGPPCGCGARGHLEAYASGTAIARAAEQALADGREGPILARIARERAPSRLSGAEVAAAELAGDQLAAEVMELARRAFAAAMVSIVDLFAPRRVVVGGGVATGQGDRLLDPARRAVREYAFREQAAQVEIVPAELGDDVGLLGALVLVEERLTVG